MISKPTYDGRRWTTQAFIKKIASDTKNRPDLRYAFVLGAGASVQSGIRGASDLAFEWVQELHARHCTDDRTVEEWATPETLGILGLTITDLAASYSAIYDRRFESDPAEGFAVLEREMEGKSPSIGYSVLAEILATTNHNVVVTTNFDNLVADGMATYTDKLPLVCGHEALAEYAQPLHRRPIVAKVHRDLLLGPYSSVKRTARLADNWGLALQHLFRHYTPVFIGYGGNDGSLMGYLEALDVDSLPSPPFWCYYAPAGAPTGRIENWIAENKGGLVPIDGFDQLMMFLGHELEYTPNKDRYLLDVAEARAQRYAEDRDALDPSSWLSWSVRAEQSETVSGAIKIYQQGIRWHIDNPKLVDRFCRYLLERSLYREAESQYRVALKKFPNRENFLDGLATALHRLGKYVEAESIWRKSLEIAPGLIAKANVGLGLNDLHKFAEAEPLLRVARSAGAYRTPGRVLSSLAVAQAHLDQARSARRNARRAEELAPDDGVTLFRVALAFAALRDDERASEVLTRARALEPAVAVWELNWDVLQQLSKAHPAAKKRKRQQPTPVFAVVEGAIAGMASKQSVSTEAS
jgi:protein O-mannosyl-transferase